MSAHASLFRALGVPSSLLALFALSGAACAGPPREEARSTLAPAAPTFSPRFAIVTDFAPGTTIDLCEGTKDAPGRGLRLFFQRTRDAAPQGGSVTLAADRMVHDVGGWLERCSLPSATATPSTRSATPEVSGAATLEACAPSCKRVAVALKTSDGAAIDGTVPIEAFRSGD